MPCSPDIATLEKYYFAVGLIGLRHHRLLKQIINLNSQSTGDLFEGSYAPRGNVSRRQEYTSDMVLPEENLDIVDQNNVATGESQPRLVVHSTGLWHRVVHVYYFREREAGLFVLVRLRSKLKDLHPNAWDTRFGGHLKHGQTVEQAVAREIQEELGLSFQDDKVQEVKWMTVDEITQNLATDPEKWAGSAETFRYVVGELTTALAKSQR